MSYTFSIGNAVPVFSKEYGDLSARWTVESKTLPEAPLFPNDDMTGQGNDRSPSYSAWLEFCLTAGIFEVFYDERRRLHGGHPGCIMLTEDHYTRTRAALDIWKRTATLPPGFSGMPEFDKDTEQWKSPDEGKYDSTLARLMWLEFWMRWALDNCETPAIQNT